MSKTILAEVEGWTPIIDHLVVEFGLTTAAVFGIIWRHCQMHDGVCRASQDHLAEMIGITRRSLNTHLGKLVKAGYLHDLTPEVKHLPHVYQDTGKASMKVTITAEVEGGEGEKNFPTPQISEKEGVKLGEKEGVNDVLSNTLKTLSSRKNGGKNAAATTTIQASKKNTWKPGRGNGSGKSIPLTFVEKLAGIIHQQDGGREVDYERLRRAIGEWGQKVDERALGGVIWSRTNIDAILEIYDTLMLTPSPEVTM